MKFYELSLPSVLQCLTIVWIYGWPLHPAAKAQNSRSNRPPNMDKHVQPGERFTLNCPHVSKNPPYEHLVVTWMLDGAIWLKIVNGETRINNKLNSKNAKKIGKNHVVNVVLNDHRYQFYYDEVVGDFNMNIRHTSPEDSGVWQCDIDIYRKNTAQKFSSYSSLQVGSELDNVVTAPHGGYHQRNNVAGQNDDPERVVFEREDGENHGDKVQQGDYGSVSQDGEKTKGSAKCGIAHVLFLCILFMNVFMRHLQ